MDDLRLTLTNKLGTLQWKEAQKKNLFNWLFKAKETIYITFSVKKPKRSLAQNNLLWLYYGILVDMGYGNYQTAPGHHGYFKKQYSKDKEQYWDNDICTLETKQMNKSEFTEYTLWLQDYTQVPIPETADTHRLFTEEEWGVFLARQRAFYKEIADIIIT